MGLESGVEDFGFRVSSVGSRVWGSPHALGAHVDEDRALGVDVAARHRREHLRQGELDIAGTKELLAPP